MSAVQIQIKGISKTKSRMRHLGNHRNHGDSLISEAIDQESVTFYRKDNNIIAMPRIGRVQSGTGIYHVMLRGINRQDIFEEP